MVEQRPYGYNQVIEMKNSIAYSTLQELSTYTDEELKVFPVQSLAIDMQPFHLQSKLANFRKFGELNPFLWNPFKLQNKEKIIPEYMSSVNNRFYSDIEK